MTTVTPLAIPEVLLITPKRFGDERGFFSETWRADTLAEAGVDVALVQDNHAFTAEPFTLRGLHFQTGPHAQAKLIRACRGAIFDVAVDVRPGSATYGRWVGAELSRDNGAQLYIPAGFAHGYATLTPDCDVLYKASAYYAPQAEGGLAWNDPAVGIDWPFPADRARLNARDAAWPKLAELAPCAFS
ncbi:dTDP-4-dehydrorhamnose 3,5-epimerase [Caulobacter sp. CCUG 60055]|uniref:dTDP-4-dehydrorhamnose 3,5-epimerase n=1 Tax=Caulobacter sp. CCUG 60055 TaxID=2100090 RepID=UPI001FA74591|nr:dTDP-4-dehydrorhamnose 3,5-epimerase [Caulobacter sp. CCUG 60055]MCI3181554.1 dTDP-4-dehydrorhamnose 3,5-epimerase [Caulobacter sp. CCUG 60055]